MDGKENNLNKMNKVRKIIKKKVNLMNYKHKFKQKKNLVQYLTKYKQSKKLKYKKSTLTKCFQVQLRCQIWLKIRDNVQFKIKFNNLPLDFQILIIQDCLLRDPSATQ
jgi:hypothetical protein